MATQGFVYKRVKADWHMLRVGGRAVFFARSRRDVMFKAAAWLDDQAAGKVAA